MQGGEPKDHGIFAQNDMTQGFFSNLMGRDVAAKVLPPNLVPNESVRKRLCKEAQALSKLNHPNIEILFELGSKEGAEFLVVV
jgi:serine/threonine protein kinase